MTVILFPPVEPKLEDHLERAQALIASVAAAHESTVSRQLRLSLAAHELAYARKLLEVRHP